METHEMPSCKLLPRPTLEARLITTAKRKEISANVEGNDDSAHADIDSGHAGGISLAYDTSLNIIGLAHSYVIGGNRTIINALANAGISSELVPMGAEGDSKQVRFSVEYPKIDMAVNAVFDAYAMLSKRVE